MCFRMIFVCELCLGLISGLEMVRLVGWSEPGALLMDWAPLGQKWRSLRFAAL